MTKCNCNKVAVFVMDVLFELAFRSLSKTAKDILPLPPTFQMSPGALIFAPSPPAYL